MDSSNKHGKNAQKNVYKNFNEYFLASTAETRSLEKIINIFFVFGYFVSVRPILDNQKFYLLLMLMN